MKKVLIISYFFPPCNLTASQRAYGWARHLKKSGYHPIVITRNWDYPIVHPEDVLKATGKSIQHEKYDDYEVYRMPYCPNLRDRLFVSFQNSPLQLISKLLTFWNLIWENYTIKAIPYRNFYKKALEIIDNENVNLLIISANPFEQFHFGYKLKEKTGLNWIADYRDDWSTSELKTKHGIADKFIKMLQKRSEKKWVRSASFITSISEHYTRKIANFSGVKGVSILNGFELPELPQLMPNSSSFTITYNGSLYPSQPIEPFLSAVKRIIFDNSTGVEICVQFPGLAYDQAQAERVRTFMSEVSDNLIITERIPREEVLNLQLKSDLVVMISHEGLKGIPSSKLYEYIGLKKTILLYPNDHDILESTLIDTGLGIICNSSDEIEKRLKELIKLKSLGKNIISKESENIELYSRERQTKKLAQLLDQI